MSERPIQAGANGSDQLGRYIPLNVIRRCWSGTDSFSTISSTEQANFTTDGEFTYIPANPISSVPNASFNRLYYGTKNDHMDSIYTTEGSYTLESVLGYPFTSSTSVPGLTAISRWYKSSVPDHATTNGGETLTGYTKEGALGRYGFARFGTATEKLLRLPASGTISGVAIESNQVAGGSLWQWYWNGIEFVNHHDMGRQIQISVAQIVDSTGASVSGQTPTECGDAYKHGSICTTISNTVSANSQTTRCIPLDWTPTNGGPDQPTMDLDVVLGKDIYLNYIAPDGVNRNWPVARFVSYVKVPNTVLTRMTEIPTIYLNASFNRFYTYDAALKTLTEVTARMPDATVNPGWAVYYTPPSGYGGVIIANASGTAAMGVYAVMTSAPYPGCATTLGLWKCITTSTDTSSTAASCTKMSVIRGINASNSGTGTLTAGVNQYNSWILTDSLANITSYMNTLYSQAAQGVH